MQLDAGSGPAPEVAPSGPDTSRANAPQAAAHLLEMAARDAEKWVSEARSEAATLLEEAALEAARLVQAGREEAARVGAELEAAKDQHETEVAELQRLASGYREQLRRHLTDLLHQVDQGVPAAATEATEPDVTA
jgi:cell division septum initiation protein DivIVA